MILLNFRYEDVIVGAPYYHGDGVGGAIFIYMNGAGVCYDFFKSLL